MFSHGCNDLWSIMPFLILDWLLIHVKLSEKLQHTGLSMNFFRVGDKSPAPRGFFKNSTGNLLPALRFLGGQYKKQLRTRLIIIIIPTVIITSRKTSVASINGAEECSEVFYTAHLETLGQAINCPHCFCFFRVKRPSRLALNRFECDQYKYCSRL